MTKKENKVSICQNNYNILNNYNVNNTNINKKNVLIENILKMNPELQYKPEFGLLGQGGYGLVFQVFYKESIFALKIFINNEKDKNNFYKKTNNEINLMRNLLDFHVVRSYYKIKDDGNFLGILMEKCNFGNLSMFVNKMNKKEFILDLNNKNKFFYLSNIGEVMIKYFAIQIIKGLKFLQNHNIVHGDIKLENILLSKFFTVKISDFSTVINIINGNKKNNINNNDNNKKNTSDLNNMSNNKTKLKNSTFSCMGSEYYKNNSEIDNKYLFKVDLFGLGVILYKMMYKQSFIPNTEKNNYNLNNFIEWRKNAYEKLKNDTIYSKELREIVKRLIDDIEDRISLDELLKNKYFFPKEKKEYKETDKIVNINRYDCNKLFIELNKLKHINNYKFLDKKYLHVKKFKVKIRK
jgi:serine/threonine protein kinase